MKSSTSSSGGGVQSIRRALMLLDAIADNGGRMTIADLAHQVPLPLASIHRLVRSLLDCGYVRQLPDRSYALGFRLVTVGAQAGRMLGSDVRAVLDKLVDALGETVNFAILSGDRAEYIAQSPSPHTMRTFTEVGSRVALHSTGVGKALLSTLGDDDVSALVMRAGLPAATEHTITSSSALLAELEKIRARGYALDEQEQELGVRCVAMPLPTDGLTRLAVSVSGPITRVTDDFVVRAVPLLTAAATQLSVTVPVAPSTKEPHVRRN